jgi:ketosteroid isomerase-like protein
MIDFKKVLFLCTVLLCTTFAVHAQNKGVSLDFDNFEADIQVLQEYTAAMKAGDAAKMNAMFTDNAAIVGLGGAMDTISKKDHLTRYIETFKGSTIDVSGDIYLAIETNENAAVGPGEWGFGWGTVSITDKKTKKIASSRYHVVVKIENGKISLLGHYYDPVPFMVQQGYKITPPKM